jgi:phosphoribosyl 1,2-cyclic phosphodiesterase
MIVRFWGVRGSLPSPLLPSVVKEKVAQIVRQAAPEDFASPESKERFLASLPPWLYGTVGGNTPCVSMEIEGFGEPVVFDCGSGMRELGLDCVSRNPKPSKYHVFFSHLHIDHLQGLPFFTPVYDPSVAFDFYSVHPGLDKALSGQTQPHFFPVRFENTASKKNFHHLKKPVSVGPAEISFKKMNHPGDSYSYKVSHSGKSCIYATDTELTPSDFISNPVNTEYFQFADMIVLDAQYTLGEAIEKYNWGHSAFSLSVDFAANWGIKKLVLFHHDPTYDDRKLYEILQSARWYLERVKAKGIEVILAVEGLVISL